MAHKIRKPQHLVTPPSHDCCPSDSFVFRTSEPTDIFYFEESISPCDGCKCLIVTNPLTMLLNQKRLDKLKAFGDGNLRDWIDSIKQNIASHQPSEVLNKLSNEEILFMVKDRHIQSMSELKNYTTYVSSNFDNFKSQLNEAMSKLEENNSSTSSSSDYQYSVKPNGAAT